MQGGRTSVLAQPQRLEIGLIATSFPILGDSHLNVPIAIYPKTWYYILVPREWNKIKRERERERNLKNETERNNDHYQA